MTRSLPIIFLACAPLIVWMYLLVGRGLFWSVRRNLQPNSDAALLLKQIAVIIPARNEEEVIAQSVASLLNQRCQTPLHIFLVDDNSSDGTARVAQEIASHSNNSTALTIISGRPLPEGWSGKLCALQQGITAALETKPVFLLLTDACIANGADSN